MIIAKSVLIGIQTCKKHTDVETLEAREPFLNQNQHAVNELDEEGMRI